MVGELVEDDKPLAYILGDLPFHPLPLPLIVRPPTLIPRPETEHWLAHLTTLLNPRPDQSFTLLDIGTGTGCIPLALVHSLRHRSPNLQAVAVDKELSAIKLAQENVAKYDSDIGCRIQILQADLFSPDFAARLRRQSQGGNGFDLIVSNPPYITQKDYRTLARSVREWEDRGALVGEAAEEESAEDDGLIFYRRIVDILDRILVETRQLPSPVAAFEVGLGQAQAVEELLRLKGFRAESFPDQWGIERLVVGYRMSK